MVLFTDHRINGSGNLFGIVHYLHDGLCAAETGLPFPQCDFLLHLFYQSVLRRSCSVLPADDTDLPSAGQLFCSAASSADVVLADYFDEELREGHSSRDYGIREDRRGRGYENLCFFDPSHVKACAGYHRPVPGPWLLERMVSVFPVSQLKGICKAFAVHPVRGGKQGGCLEKLGGRTVCGSLRDSPGNIKNSINGGKI